MVVGSINKHYKSGEILSERSHLLNVNVRSVKMKENNSGIRVLLDTFQDKVKFMLFSNILVITTNIETYQSLYTMREEVERFNLNFLKKTLGVKKTCGNLIRTSLESATSNQNVWAQGMHFIFKSLGINEVWTKNYLPSKIA